MSHLQKYLIAVAYGLGWIPSIPVQLDMSRSFWKAGYGASVQLMAEKVLDKNTM